MLIAIKRYYKNTDLEREIIINTDYIIRIEETKEFPETRIIMDPKVPNDTPDLIYTNETIQGIKVKVGISRNRRKKSGTKRASK